MTKNEYVPLRQGQDETLALTKIPVAELADRVLVVGDPDRAAKAAGLLANAKPIAKNREYHSYVGEYEGKRITVASHGVGAAGAACCFEELCRGGAKYIIRAGTAGGVQREVVDGDLLVVTGAVRCDGYTELVVPMNYPAVPDLQVTSSLVRTAEESDLNTHAGVVITSANFYPSPILGNDQPKWRDAGAIGVEMEVAALFITASIHRVKSGAILAIDGNPLKDEDEDMTSYEPDREIVTKAIDATLETSLKVLASLE